MIAIKKKIFLWIGIAVVVVATAIIFITTNGAKPFRDMTADVVESATVTLVPPDTTIQLTEEDTQQLVALLQEVVVYRKDNSYTQYAGQSVAFTITKTDGTQVVVNAYYPFIIIDEIGYRVEQESCSKLQDFANQLR